MTFALATNVPSHGIYFAIFSIGHFEFSPGNKVRMDVTVFFSKLNYPFSSDILHNVFLRVDRKLTNFLRNEQFFAELFLIFATQ